MGVTDRVSAVDYLSIGLENEYEFIEMADSCVLTNVADCYAILNCYNGDV